MASCLFYYFFNLSLLFSGWIARQFGKPNGMWSPLDDSGEESVGSPGRNWTEGGATTDSSPLVIGQGLPFKSSSVCKAVPVEEAEEAEEATTTLDEKPTKKRRFFFF